MHFQADHSTASRKRARILVDKFCETRPDTAEDAKRARISAEQFFQPRPGVRCEDVVSERTTFMLGMKSDRVPGKKESDNMHDYHQRFGLDHLEYHLGKDGTKYQVCSQVGPKLRLTSEQLEKEGWEKIPSIYCSGQDTYIRKFDPKRDSLQKKIQDLVPKIRDCRENRKIFWSDAGRMLDGSINPIRKLLKLEKRLKSLEQEIGYKYSELLGLEDWIQWDRTQRFEEYQLVFAAKISLNVVPHPEKCDFGLHQIHPEYRKELYKKFPKYTAEEVIGAYLGHCKHFPSQEEWLCGDSDEEW